MSQSLEAVLLVAGGISLFTGSAGSLFLFLAGPVDDTLVARRRFMKLRGLALLLVGIGALMFVISTLSRGT